MTALEIVFESILGKATTHLISDNVIGVNFARAGAFVCHLAGFFLQSADIVCLDVSTTIHRHTKFFLSKRLDA